jgi:hypothetical protein
MPDAPRLRKDQITKITDALEYLEIAEFFGGALGTAAEVVPLIGDLAALSLELIDWRSGLRNSDAVRKRLIGNDADG